jgi:hypothetical protein
MLVLVKQEVCSQERFTADGGALFWSTATGEQSPAKPFSSLSNIKVYRKSASPPKAVCCFGPLQRVYRVRRPKGGILAHIKKKSLAQERFTAEGGAFLPLKLPSNSSAQK